MNQILYSEKDANNSNKIIIAVLAVLLVVVIIAILVISSIISDKILANVYVGDVNVGMQTKEKAENMILPYMSEYEVYNIKVSLGEKNVIYSANDLGIDTKGSVENMVNSAYSFGRDGNFFTNTSTLIKSYFSDRKIAKEIKFDDERFDTAIGKLAEGNEAIPADDSYEKKGNEIYIRKGTDGMKIDYDLAKSYVATAIINGVNNVELPMVEGVCKKIDLEKLYDEIYVEPQDAICKTGEKFEIIVDKAGVYFDLEEAKTNYEKLNPGEEMIIKLKEVKPKVTVADLDKELFSNVLSTYSCSYDQSETDRVKNLKVAAERCNNTILYPGDEFSYNKALGTRTVANGFAPGHSFAGGRVVTTIGGGICQVSSALYNVVLEADLEVTNRVAHGMYVGYVKPSLDATVVDGAIDFKFKNNRKYPVKIEASAENGVVKVSLYGIKDKDEPIIEIESVILETIPYKTVNENDSSMKKGTTKVVQEPVNGYVSEAYRVEKDSDGKIISRTLISKDRYIATNKIVKVGTKVPTQVQTPPPVEVITPVDPTPTTPVQKPEDEEQNNDDGEGLPEGWDSPESPYANGNEN